MSDSTTTGPATSEQEDSFAGLFAQLVMQQANMAMMLLGKVAHPETGKVVKDMEAARYFIDQLEMLEVKTKGNLTKEESALLKQSLMSLRLAFVDAVDSEPSDESAQPADQQQAQPGPGSAAAEKSGPQGSAEEEHRKKFSKKY